MARLSVKNRRYSSIPRRILLISIKFTCSFTYRLFLNFFNNATNKLSVSISVFSFLSRGRKFLSILQHFFFFNDRVAIFILHICYVIKKSVKLKSDEWRNELIIASVDVTVNRDTVHLKLFSVISKLVGTNYGRFIAL